MSLYEYLSGYKVSVQECMPWAKYELDKECKSFVLKHAVWTLLNTFLIFQASRNPVAQISLVIIYGIINYSFLFRHYMAILRDYTRDPQHTFTFINRSCSDLIMLGVLGQGYGIPWYLPYIRYELIISPEKKNVWDLDLSSTRQYQRDSLLHFLYHWTWRYSPLFSFCDAILICLYLNKPEKAVMHLFSTVLLVSLAILTSAWYLLLFNLTTSILEAFTEWVRRMFISIKCPTKWFLYDTINNATKYQNPRNHSFQNVLHTMQLSDWRSAPNGFLHMCSHYDQDEVLIIQKLNDIQIGALVFSGRLDLLAGYVVSTKKGGHDIEQACVYLRDMLKSSSE